ncbi:MAG TPA: PadR family transcriptional regulator [Nocardioides sp.]|nr:PadR family transcriptional regulator [Nocardioides sp.]
MTHRFEKRMGPFWLAGNLPDCGPGGFGGHRHQHRPGPWGWATEGGPGQHGPGRPGGMGGPPPWLAGLFGLGRPEGARGPRVRRGDVRAAILDVLRTAAAREEPINGYQVIQQITEKSGGAWKPSPGSVYPTISQLEDEGLVASGDEGGRRSLRLTEAGQTYCADNSAELEDVWTPFRSTSDERPAHADFKAEIGQVMSALWQIITTGSEAQKDAAVEVLVDARRRLYGILADGPGPDAADE